eukprot:14758867-Alexandrium_andersonii.AAC.1
MLTDRTALHLVRPLGNETNLGNTETQGSSEQRVMTGDPLAIEDEYEALDEGSEGNQSSF